MKKVIEMSNSMQSKIKLNKSVHFDKNIIYTAFLYDKTEIASPDSP